MPPDLSTSANFPLSSPCLAQQNPVTAIAENLASLCLMQVRGIFGPRQRWFAVEEPGKQGQVDNVVLMFSNATSS